MQCPKCRYENSQTAQFCGECGQRLSMACPTCSFAAAPSAKFCPKCGQQLTRPPSSLGVTGHSAAPQTYTPTYLQALALAGRMEDAMQHAWHALELSRAHKEQGYQAWVFRLLGEIHSHRGPLDAQQAEEYYRQALSLAEDLGMRPLQAHCHLGLSTRYAKIRQREQARTEPSVAIELYRAMEMTFWLPQAEAALLQVEGR